MARPNNQKNLCTIIELQALHRSGRQHFGWTSRIQAKPLLDAIADVSNTIVVQNCPEFYQHLVAFSRRAGQKMKDHYKDFTEYPDFQIYPAFQNFVQVCTNFPKIVGLANHVVLIVSESKVNSLRRFIEGLENEFSNWSFSIWFHPYSPQYSRSPQYSCSSIDIIPLEETGLIRNDLFFNESLLSVHALNIWATSVGYAIFRNLILIYYTHPEDVCDLDGNFYSAMNKKLQNFAVCNNMQIFRGGVVSTNPKLIFPHKTSICTQEIFCALFRVESGKMPTTINDIKAQLDLRFIIVEDSSIIKKFIQKYIEIIS